MHRINDAIVRDGKVQLTGLPFADGQHVRIVVATAGERMPKGDSIERVRRKLKGCVERFDNPTEPMIPDETWEMLG